MADNLSKAQRSYCMSRIKGRDTSLEKVVRGELHRRGYRFRKHVADLPGKPDIVFPRQGVVVFIEGGFWHGWRFPLWRDKVSLFWRTKIEGNRRRDAANFRKLRKAGWTVIRVWQHQVQRDCAGVIARITAAVKGSAVNPRRRGPLAARENKGRFP